MPADLSPNRERAEHTLRAALTLLGMDMDYRIRFRLWAKAGKWPAAVGVVCDQLDAAEERGALTPTTEER